MTQQFRTIRTHHILAAVVHRCSIILASLRGRWMHGQWPVFQFRWPWSPDLHQLWRVAHSGGRGPETGAGIGRGGTGVSGRSASGGGDGWDGGCKDAWLVQPWEIAMRYHEIPKWILKISSDYAFVMGNKWWSVASNFIFRGMLILDKATKCCHGQYVNNLGNSGCDLVWPLKIPDMSSLSTLVLHPGPNEYDEWAIVQSSPGLRAAAEESLESRVQKGEAEETHGPPSGCDSHHAGH